MSTGLKPVWAGRNIRLDPSGLPQVVSYATRDDFGDVTFTIDHRGAIVKRILQMSGLPATVVLPANAFRGIAARAMEDPDSNVTVTLELLHNDPMLSVPLLVADIWRMSRLTGAPGPTPTGFRCYSSKRTALPVRWRNRSRRHKGFCLPRTAANAA